MKLDLSIIIPTYNRADTVRDCLNSILEQIDLTNFEVIVCDNASPEQSTYIELIDCYQNLFLHIGGVLRYHSNATNLGVVANKRQGVSMARGEYVVISDDDDFYIDKLFFSRALQNLRANKQASVLVSKVKRIYDDGNEHWVNQQYQKLVHSGSQDLLHQVKGNDYFKGFWTKFGPRQSNASIAKRSVLLERGWDTFECNDQSFHLLVSLGYTVIIDDNVVAIYRKHKRANIKGNETTGACPIKCFESHTVIKAWLDFSSFYSRGIFIPWLWRMKNLILKDQGSIRWLSDQSDDKLNVFLNEIKSYNYFHYFIVRNFNLYAIRYYRAKDPVGFLSFVRFKLKRFFAISILKIDRLIH